MRDLLPPSEVVRTQPVISYTLWKLTRYLSGAPSSSTRSVEPKQELLLDQSLPQPGLIHSGGEAAYAKSTVKPPKRPAFMPSFAVPEARIVWCVNSRSACRS